MDGLPTKDRLERSHVFTAQECAFCNFHKESDDHLFYECDFVKRVFAKIKESLCWPDIPSFDRCFRMGENIASMRDKGSQDEICKVFISWWFIWYARNKVVFAQDSLVPFGVTTLILKFFENWRHTQGLDNCVAVLSSSKPSAQPKEMWWVNPPPPKKISLSSVLMALKWRMVGPLMDL